MTRRFLPALCATAALALSLPLPRVAAAQETFTLDLEGKRVEIPIRRLAGVRYVALEDLARGFGGRVDWLEVGEKASAVFLDQRIVFRRDVPFVEARGQLHQIPHAPRLDGGELYVPFSFIQQGLPAIFPERFDFEPQTSSLRLGPPGSTAGDIDYLVAPGLTTLRLFFAGGAPRVSADNSIPHTLVLRLEGATLGESAAAALAGLGLVQRVRLEMDDQGLQRLVLLLAPETFLYQVARLEDPAGIEVTLFSPASGVDPEVVLARVVTPGTGGLPPPPYRAAPSGEAASGDLARVPGAGSSAPPREPADAAARGRRPTRPRAGIRTVFIDAGHGGRDVGAVGPSGIQEKDVTLQVARALREELLDRADLNVVLTRDTDVFVPLTVRTRMANDAGADLFISIHCNASPAPTGAGFETYFLSEAKTEDARRVARMENASLRFEDPSLDPDRLGDLNFILWDLAQNEYLRESSLLAEIVQRGIADELELKDRGVKQAGFWVLNGAFMPAILVETAFISNPDEERLLASPDFQTELVDGIADSVMEYVDTYERKVTLQEVGT